MSKDKFYITQTQEGMNFPLPKYMTKQAAGMDLVACVIEDIVIKKGEIKLIPTGIKIALPSGFEAQIRARSGLALKNGITLINGVGTVDADYRGEITIPLINLGSSDFVVKRGERIAQMVINKFEQVEFELVQELDETIRGESGFGSTGR